MRKWKNVMIALLVVVFFSVVYGIGQWEEDRENAEAEPQENKIHLRLANDLNREHISSQACDYFADRVHEKSEGRIEIHVYHGGQLGGQAEAVEQLWFGGIDFARVGLMALEEEVPATDAFIVPNLFESDKQLWTVLESDAGQKLKRSLEEKGYIPLFYELAGMQAVYSDEPIYSPQDLVGLRIRVPDNQVVGAVMESLGITPVFMPWTEVYDAVQNDVIDGAADNMVSYFEANHDEVAGFCLSNPYEVSPDIIVASDVTFSELSLEDQALIQECGLEAERWHKEAWREAEQAAFLKAAENKEINLSVIAPSLTEKTASIERYWEALPVEAKMLLVDIQNILK